MGSIKTISFRGPGLTSFSGPVASVTNNNPLETAAEMRAVIDWGDGSAPTAGIITGTNGQFVVSGTHTYTSAGHYLPLIDVTERDGVTVRASTPFGGIEAGPAIDGTVLASGDFNGDGLTDLVTIGLFGTAATELTQADGTFSAPIALPLGALSSGSSLGLAADFNGDGKLDLAIVAFDPSVNTYDLRVLIGNGDGTFQAGPVGAPLGPGLSIAAGDFNGDHHVDLALELVSGFSVYGFDVMLGNGDGSFAAPVNYRLGTYSPTITVADLRTVVTTSSSATAPRMCTSPRPTGASALPERCPGPEE
jgi:FG-GAP-like repeat/FG-GAP repeat